MSKLKLTYFDFNGGRGEPIRLALVLGGVAFEDERITFEQWPALKPKMPFQALPVLEVDGQTLSQSNAITRYVGRLADLYPTDPWQAALCDEVMDSLEDIGQRLFSTIPMDNEDEKRRVREALASGPIPMHLARLNSCLQARGGNYFADNRLTIADLKVFVWVKQLRSGMLDYIPVGLVDQFAPLLAKQCEQLGQQDEIRAYYAGR